jgi:hypothetical protein
MVRRVQLFASSSPELGPEREALGQAVAELPIALGWEIRHTPRPAGHMADTLDFVRRCDVYVILLGHDFSAPMGLEWGQARRAGRRTLALRKEVPHSPSARALLRESSAEWATFRSPAELKRQLMRALAQMLLDHGEQLGLHMADVEGLLRETARGAEAAPEEPDRREGAGHRAVILGRE